MAEVELLISPDGRSVRAIYTDDYDFRALGLGLGSLSISRASHVEPTPDGKWDADMTPVGGPSSLGPFNSRAAALAAEAVWLRENALCSSATPPAES